MTREETIIKDITTKFRYTEGKYTIPRPRRIFVNVSLENYKDIIKYLHEKLKFQMLCTITGLDNVEEFEAIYHIANEEGIIINLKLSIPKSKACIETITDIFQGATLYERELKDMFGITVSGLPEGHRYPLTDEWPEDQHPLQKEWKNVKPSIEEGGAE
jgi:Ni,Fe-hydrogenase III component G